MYKKSFRMLTSTVIQSFLNMLPANWMWHKVFPEMFFDSHFEVLLGKVDGNDSNSYKITLIQIKVGMFAWSGFCSVR